MPRKVEEFRIDLADEYVEYYHKIKQLNHIDKKVDVFRHAIKITHDMEMEGVTPYTAIPQRLREEIKRYTSREDVQDKYRIYRYEDFLQKGIEMLLDEIKSFTQSRSILHWDVRNSLSGDRKDVALVIKDLLLDDPYGEVSFDRIYKELGWRDKNRLKRILDEFVYQNLLETELIRDQRIYHATLDQ